MDGCALAYATLYYLIENIRCFTLFVTHYWLLTLLEEQFESSVGNFHMSFMENHQNENRTSYHYFFFNF